MVDLGWLWLADLLGDPSKLLSLGDSFFLIMFMCIAINALSALVASFFQYSKRPCVCERLSSFPASGLIKSASEGGVIGDNSTSFLHFLYHNGCGYVIGQ